MPKVNQSAEFSSRLKLLFWAAFSLLLGLGMIFFPYRLFGILMTLLPWALLLAGVKNLVDFVQLYRRNKKFLLKLSGAVLLLVSGALLLKFIHWRDVVLWYIFVGYLIISAYIIMRPAWQPGLEKQIFSRTAGALTVWGFAVLLLFMPRSGLSEALLLLGVFTVGWGMFQLLLPPAER